MLVRSLPASCAWLECPAMKFRYFLILWLVAFLLSTILAVKMVPAHEAPSGWEYPWYCCSNKDCHPAQPGDIQEGPSGYTLTTTGEVVPYDDRRVKTSPDGVYHVCQQDGDFDHGRILCLFSPPKSY
jgi:hypothetical protein